MLSVNQGLAGVVAFDTEIAEPDRDGGALRYRGIDIAKTKVLGQDALAFETALQGMGDAGVGIITVSNYDYNHQSAMNKDFVKAYNDEYHRNPDIFSIGGYDGMHLIYAALEKTGCKIDADGSVSAMKGLVWESPRGPISIDPDTRDIVSNIYIRKVEKINGELWAKEFETFPNVKDPMKVAAK